MTTYAIWSWVWHTSAERPIKRYLNMSSFRTNGRNSYVCFGWAILNFGKILDLDTWILDTNVFFDTIKYLRYLWLDKPPNHRSPPPLGRVQIPASIIHLSLTIIFWQRRLYHQCHRVIRYITTSYSKKWTTTTWTRWTMIRWRFAPWIFRFGWARRRWRVSLVVC